MISKIQKYDEKNIYPIRSKSKTRNHPLTKNIKLFKKYFVIEKALPIKQYLCFEIVASYENY